MNTGRSASAQKGEFGRILVDRHFTDLEKHSGRRIGRAADRDGGAGAGSEEEL